MVVYTLEQHWEILRHYFENHGNVAECVAKLRTDFRRREAPSAPYVRYLLKKVKEPGIVIDKPKRENPKTASAAESMCEAPSTSIHSRSQQFNISDTSLRRILHRDLGMTPYKVQLLQVLKPIDYPMCFWSESAIDLYKMPILAKKKILF